MSASEEYAQHLQEARRLLIEGETREAFKAIRPVLQYPGMVSDRTALAETLGLFRQIGQQIAGESFAEVVAAAAGQPDDWVALYRLGYELIESGLPDLAATVLTWANALAPDEEQVLTELVAALEEDMRPEEACRVLRASPALLERSFLCRYLLAFDSLMSGDLATARALNPELQRTCGDDERYQFMAGRVDAMVQRADAVIGVSALDGRDLRGWHFVLNGGLLLHRSPFGLDEGMNGRYAYIHDTEAVCLEGIRKLRAVLEHLRLSVPQVFVLSERKSAVLAHVLAHTLGCALVPWPEEGSHEPGLIAAYDLSALDEPVLRTLREQRPGQMLWGHALCWTTTFPIAADFVTYLYQYNVSPWEGGMRVTEDRQVVDEQRDETETTDAAALAARLLAGELMAEALDDLPELLALARAAATATGSAAPGALRSTGTRNKQWAGSAVPSSRFL